MGSLRTGRVTPQRSVVLARLPMPAGEVIFAGALVVLNAAGYAAPGTAAAGLRAMGRCEQTVDNSEGADGEASVLVRREGTFLWGNASGADQVTLQDLNRNCYILDDQTVARDSDGGARSPAGIVAGVEEGGVWVELGVAASADSPAAMPGMELSTSDVTLSQDQIRNLHNARVLLIPSPGQGMSIVVRELLFFRESGGRGITTSRNSLPRLGIAFVSEAGGQLASNGAGNLFDRAIYSETASDVITAASYAFRIGVGNHRIVSDTPLVVVANAGEITGDPTGTFRVLTRYYQEAFPDL